MGKLLKKDLKLSPSKKNSIKKLKSKKVKTRPLVLAPKPDSDSEIEKLEEPVYKSVKNAIFSSYEEKYKVKYEHVEMSLRGVLKLIDDKSKEKNELFDDERSIFLQICAVKVPKCPSRVLRLPLKHTLLTDSSEICLITPDLPNSNKKDHDKVIEHYEQFLKTNGVDNIKTIMPYHQLRTEYEQFELRRRLVDLYDVFLVDGKISGYVVHLLGKIFYKKRKMPVPVKLGMNIKKEIDKALLKVPLTLHSKSDSFIVQVGHSKMEIENMIENVYGIVEALAKHFPGGWDNIRSLSLKGPETKSCPVYLTLKNKKSVKVPVIKSKRPKAFKEVQGELTTKLNTRVRVFPDGKVWVQKTNDETDDEDLNAEELEDNNLEEDDGFVKNEEEKTIKRKKLTTEINDNKKQKKIKTSKKNKK